MAKKRKTPVSKLSQMKSNGLPLNTEDLDKIVGGATTQQYDATKQQLLGEINNADVANAVAADAAAIAASPTQAHIAAAITDIETHAGADHVSQAAALAALDAATYGNAKVGGVDAVATELTKVLTNGAAEADAAHLAALGTDPGSLITQLGQAVNVLAMGSANGHTALGLQTNAAVDWVEAKLEAAAAHEAATDNAAANSQLNQGWAALFSNSSTANSHFAAANTDIAEATAATALQSLLDTAHSGEVAEGKGIDALMTALGSNVAQIQADANTLIGLSGAAAATAGAQEAIIVEGIAGVQKDAALVALDLFSQGNAGVQQALYNELHSGAIETNLASAVATGALGADQAVQILNLAVTDLAQNSINPGTMPGIEQNFAIAQADVALANAAGSLAAADLTAANLIASGYAAGGAAGVAADQHQAQLAQSLQTLINTNYAPQVALAGELSAIAAELGANAATYIQDGVNLIANPSLAAGYISAIEAAAATAEAAATPGSPHGAFSVDAALTLLAIYSNGNSTVLNEIEARLANGTAEADLAKLAALGAITAAQAVTTLTGMVDTLAGVSPNGIVTLTASDGSQLALTRGDAVNWAEGQLAKVVVPMQNAVAVDAVNLLVTTINNAFGTATHQQVVTAQNTLNTAVAEAGNVNALANLLETTHGNEVVAGLGIDAAWVSARTSADAAAIIAAGTSVVQTGYGPESQVSAAATAQANALEQSAAQQEQTDFNIADQVIQANLNQVWASNLAAGQTTAAAAVSSSGTNMASLFGKGGELVENNFRAVQSAVNAYEDPSFANFARLGEDVAAGLLISKSATVLSLATEGMAALMESDAVSGVIGAQAAGDLATTFKAVHDATAGAIGLFTDAVEFDGQAAIDLGNQAVTIGENTYTLGSDLIHGNTGALANDAKTLFTNLGNATLAFAEDMGGVLTIGVPLQDAGAMLTNLGNALSKVGIDILGASEFASVQSAVKSEAETILTGLENYTPVVGSALQSAFAPMISALTSSLESGWDSFVGDMSSVGDDIGHYLNPLNW